MLPISLGDSLSKHASVFRKSGGKVLRRGTYESFLKLSCPLSYAVCTNKSVQELISMAFAIILNRGNQGGGS